MKTTPRSFDLNVMQSDVMQSVVHDLRTPITIIKGYLQLLINGNLGDMPSEQKAVLQRSVGPLDDLIALTDNLLHSHSLEQGQVELTPSPLDVDGLLAELIAFYQLSMQQHDIRIFREGNTLGQKILVDSFLFKRVLHNLIGNAFKFTPKGGQVSLIVDRPRGGLEIAVQDTGRGIPADRLEQIFEKFVQVMPEKDRKAGCGLGLWICSRVMELHGGRISVSSSEGHGSRFSLWLPPQRLL